MDKKDWLTDDGLTLLRGWAREGLTNKELSLKMGVSRQTLQRWCREEPVLARALRDGKESADFKVENALYKTAMEGNVAAQIFWLKNRRPDRWREQPRQTASDDEIPRFVDDVTKTDDKG